MIQNNPDLPPIVWQPIIEEETISFEWDPALDGHEKIILVNEKVWDGNAIDRHSAKQFVIEWIVLDEEGKILHNDKTEIEGDVQAPAIEVNVPDLLMLDQPYTLFIAADDDVKMITLLVDQEEKELDENRSFVIDPSMKQIEITAIDQAGNETVKTIDLLTYEKPVFSKEGRNRTVEGLHEKLQLLHNGKPVTEKEILLEKGKNTFRLTGECLLEPIDLESIDYDPQPVEMSVYWENDQLICSFSKEVIDCMIQVNGQQTDSAIMEWKASDQKQTLTINAKVTDQEQNEWEMKQTIVIEGLPAKEEPAPVPDQLSPEPPVAQEVPQVPVLDVLAPLPQKQPFLPIVMNNTAAIKDQAVLDKTITIDEQNKVSVEIKEEKIDQKMELQLVDENLIPLEKESDSSKVRIVLKEMKEIESIQVNGQTIETNTLERDHLDQWYFEIETEPNDYVIDVVYRDSDQNKATMNSRFSIHEKEEKAQSPSKGMLSFLMAPLSVGLHWLFRRYV